MTCFLCGSTDRVEVHHIDWNHWHDVPSNRMNLCRKCHVELHRVGYLSYWDLDNLRRDVLVAKR